MAALLEKKRVLLLMPLIIFVTLQMMFGLVYGALIHHTKVTITNTMSQAVTIHCRDKNTDKGYHVLQPNVGYSLWFIPNPIFKRTLWYCSFDWTEEGHNFDIYVQERDKCQHRICSWLITENGPCRVTNYPKNPECFPWN
ncbi:unnamed protein product [Lupinus luteus]|uniref:S-protein homolog n=1 Tax=Lupinus luteus TaxID=3873 RepID=A0AAV1X6R8_LUPLU